MPVEVKSFFHEDTSTLTYLVLDPRARDCIVIDPVADFDPAGSVVSYESTRELIDTIVQEKLVVRAILETHAHADHISGSQFLKKKFREAPLVIGSGIKEVQEAFKTVLELPDAFPTDGRQFDRLVEDGEHIRAGTLLAQVIFTPGHTPACVSYLIEDKLFTGDALFMPDSGTGRCDFPGGDAHKLYKSISGRLYNLPDSTEVYVGHDYQPNDRKLEFQSSIGEEKKSNIHLQAQTTEADFVSFRKKRDATLNAPRLLYPSIQVNIDGGRLPAPTRKRARFLKIPLHERT